MRLAGLLCVGFLLPAIASAESQLAARAQTILKKNCYRCHGQDGANEGGLNYLMDAKRLVARRIVVAGDSRSSPLIQRVIGDPPDMPLDGPALSRADVATLKEWIDAGAENFSESAVEREFVSTVDINNAIGKHLDELPELDRPFARYFVLTHLYNAGIPDDELATYRSGLSLLVNSLSWGQKIEQPRPIDAAKTILHIDLRWYLWKPNTWDKQILGHYPYGVQHNDVGAKTTYELTSCTQPAVRGDWFVAAASVPPLYHNILELPASVQELQTRLGSLNLDYNLQSHQAIRAGFDKSGISLSNRLIERHKLDLTNEHGYFWISRDTINNKGRRNFFVFPLGPATAFEPKKSFEFDGGEIIFTLPNGLQAYMLTQADGQRIDAAPTNIVVDRQYPSTTVVNGLSCFRCHYSNGIIPKNDQIRNHVIKNDFSFSQKERLIIESLYQAQDKLSQVYAADSKQFREAVNATGSSSRTTDPVNVLASRFAEPLDARLAAAEVGLPESEFVRSVEASPNLRRRVGQLISGATIPRDAFAESIPAIIDDLELGIASTLENPPNLHLHEGNDSSSSTLDQSLETFVVEACATFNAVEFNSNTKIFAAWKREASFNVVISGATTDEVRLVREAIEVLNKALPASKRFSIGDDAEIHLHFAPRYELPQLYRKNHEQQISANALSASFSSVKETYISYKGTYCYVTRFDGYIARDTESESTKFNNICVQLLRSLGINAIRQITASAPSVLTPNRDGNLRGFTETDLTLARFFLNWVDTSHAEKDIRNAFGLYWEATKDQLKVEGALPILIKN